MGNVETTLLVEDNAIFRQAFKDALLTYFPAMQVMEAANGVRALEIVREACPHLIFMDLKLPHESGLDLTKKIRRLCPEAKIIILTAYDALEYREAAAAAGAVDFAVKGSLSMEDIAGLIRGLDAA